MRKNISPRKWTEHGYAFDLTPQVERVLRPPHIVKE